MTRRKALEATDPEERRILKDINAREGGGRAWAAAILGAKEDVIAHMWASSPGRSRREMRLWEARLLAEELGYTLECTPKTAGLPKVRPKSPRRRAAS